MHVFGHTECNISVRFVKKYNLKMLRTLIVCIAKCAEADQISFRRIQPNGLQSLKCDNDGVVVLHN